MMDPTDRQGNVPLMLEYLLGFIKISTTMARMNEPPPGYSVNCITSVDNGSPNEMNILTVRNIYPEGKLHVSL